MPVPDVLRLSFFSRAIKGVLGSCERQRWCLTHWNITVAPPGVGVGGVAPRLVTASGPTRAATEILGIRNGLIREFYSVIVVFMWMRCVGCPVLAGFTEPRHELCAGVFGALHRGFTFWPVRL